MGGPMGGRRRAAGAARAGRPPARGNASAAPLSPPRAGEGVGDIHDALGDVAQQHAHDALARALGRAVEVIHHAEQHQRVQHHLLRRRRRRHRGGAGGRPAARFPLLFLFELLSSAALCAACCEQRAMSRGCWLEPCACRGVCAAGSGGGAAGGRAGGAAAAGLGGAAAPQRAKGSGSDAATRERSAQSLLPEQIDNTRRAGVSEGSRPLPPPRHSPRLPALLTSSAGRR